MRVVYQKPKRGRRRKYCEGCRVEVLKEQTREADRRRDRREYYRIRDKTEKRRESNRERARVRYVAHPRVRRDQSIDGLYGCSMCKRRLPRGLFSSNGRYPDGGVKIRNECKDCGHEREARKAARKRGAGAPEFSDFKSVSGLLERQGHRCAYCQCELRRLGDGKVNYHLDHRVPLSRGGMHVIENLQVLCVDCNLRKGSKLPEEFGYEAVRG